MSEERRSGTEKTMNGADALITTLADNGVTACFANPGTSEMQFVAALDREPRMRSVLCLFEGVATGAADGYGRMAGKPACTLLHLGPGYANGAANLHNARRAYTPIVNVIGDHATYHRGFDAPLNSDIAALAAPNSVWIKSAESADSVGPLAAEAIVASYGAPGGNACLVLPADSAWNEATVKGPVVTPPVFAGPDKAAVEAVARALSFARKPVLLLGSGACGEAALAAAGRLAAYGVRVLTDTFTARQARGEGRFRPDKLPYFAEQALKDLDGVDLMVLVSTTRPVAFFAYPDRPSVLVPEGCSTETLCGREVDAAAALNALADAVSAPDSGPAEAYAVPAAPTGHPDPLGPRPRLAVPDRRRDRPGHPAGDRCGRGLPRPQGAGPDRRRRGHVHGARALDDRPREAGRHCRGVR
jgi:acetolactate synthase-1/2/3 large subunit